jgi:hypothetical protein
MLKVLLPSLGICGEFCMPTYPLKRSDRAVLAPKLGKLMPVMQARIAVSNRKSDLNCNSLQGAVLNSSFFNFTDEEIARGSSKAAIDVKGSQNSNSHSIAFGL